jgi:uncharacterized protein YndB with AHSA1/START domain
MIMSDTLSIETQLRADTEAVFTALTDPAALRTWLADEADVDLPAGRFGFAGRHTPQGDTIRQRLITVEPGQRLAFAWTLDDQETTVDLRLSGDDGRTTLRLTQDPMPTLDELMAPTGRRDGLHSMHTYWGLALANLAEYVEGRALTPRADFGADRPAEIRTQLIIDASPAEVFESLTDPKQVARWFGWEVQIDPRLGGKIAFGAEGKIIDFEPGRTLAYEDGDGAIVRWELEGSDGKTFLTFVETGYRDDELDNAAQHEAGWLGAIAELKRMHELGDDWTPLTTELPVDDDQPDPTP